MQCHSNNRYRRSVRLENYDYRQEGVYFITICTHQHGQLFGEIVQMKMHLNEYGQIALSCWEAIPSHFPHVELDMFVIMPNHMHGIVLIVDDIITKSNTTPLPTTPPIRQFSKPVAGSLGIIINAYKSSVTRIIRQTYPDMTDLIWQRNYYEHIIRDEIALITIRNYIEHNPSKWEEDTFFKA